MEKARSFDGFPETPFGTAVVLIEGGSLAVRATVGVAAHTISGNWVNAHAARGVAFSKLPIGAPIPHPLTVAAEFGGGVQDAGVGFHGNSRSIVSSRRARACRRSLSSRRSHAMLVSW